MDRSLIYITVPNLDEARRIGRHLVSERLAACVNLIDGMHSLYWWDGAIQEDEEVILLAKTRSSLVPNLIKAVRALHSYECPCIVSLPIEAGHQPFLDWIGEETRQRP